MNIKGIIWAGLYVEDLQRAVVFLPGRSWPAVYKKGSSAVHNSPTRRVIDWR